MQDKKNTTIGVRVDDDLHDTLKQLATGEDRPVAAMARILIVEALKARGHIKSSS
jgi:hypothetical protein